MVVAALGQATSPRLAEAFGRGDTREFRRVLGWLLALGASLGVLGVVVAALASGPILTLLYGAEYATQSRTFVWLMVAAGITYAYVFLGTATTAMRRFRIQLPIELAGVLVILAASGILVPRWGLLGAAWALCASAGTLACLYFLVVGRAIVRGDDRPPERRPARAGEPPAVGGREP
jgi:O-antigen/teichoic acid export membrane protein